MQYDCDIERSYFVASLKLILFLRSNKRRNNIFTNRALCIRCLCDIGFIMMRNKAALKNNKYAYCHVKHIVYRALLPYRLYAYQFIIM